MVAKERVKKTAQETRSILNKMQNGGGAVSGAGQRAGNIFPPLNIKSSNLHMFENRQQKQTTINSGPTITEQLESGKRVSIQDLSWDDKELVLRVLFAKMNGTQSAASHSVRAGGHRGGGKGSHDQPVFVSEGGDLPPSEYAGSVEYQAHFEVQSHRRSSNDSSRLDDRGTEEFYEEQRRSGNSSFNGGGGDDEDSI